MTSVESAFRSALRGELGRPLSELMDRLLRVAGSLSGRAGSAARPVRALAAAVVAPEPEACAVIGCPLPRGEAGFCKAHSLQRQQMIDSGRLHPQWVEGAAPHSVPNVIPPRKRRGEGQRAASPSPVKQPALPVSEPRMRMFVRKKSEAAVTVTPTGRANAVSKAGPRVEPKQEERQQIASTLGRWANEFKSRKK
jgi:hypothetical protein